MKIIMTDEVMDVAPGVMIFTKERLAEILAFARSGIELPKSQLTPNAADLALHCEFCGHITNTVPCPHCGFPKAPNR